MGVLRKRRKRNIIRVSGNGASEAQLVDKTTPFSSESQRIRPDFCRMEKETGRNRKSLQRITRDPSFHITPLMTFPEEELTESKTKQVQQRGPENVLLPPMEVESADGTFKDDRTLLNKSSMNRLRFIIHVSAISGALPWRWDKINRQILQWESRSLKLWWVQWSLVTFQTFCLCIRQCWMFAGRLSMNSKEYRVVFMSSLSIYFFVFALLFRLIVYLRQEDMRSYINSMLRFNQEYVGQYLLHLDGHQQGGMIIMNLSIPLVFSQIWSCLAFFLIFHDQPWYLSSQIPYKDWYWLIPGAMQEVIVVGSDISIYMLMAWIIVAHTCTVDFWLQESHNQNTINFTSDELRRPEISTQTYRALSVLNSTFNSCMAGLAIPNLKLTVFLGLIICGYVMVRSMNQLFIEEFPSILLYPVGIINCAATGFGCLYMSAHMYDVGISFVDSWSQTSDKGLRRFLISCFTMKVWVGRFYFVTVVTIITFFRIVTDQIIYCIISFP